MLISMCSYGQIWIVGDTMDYIETEVATEFLPDSKVSFDLDCDGLEDVNINSSGPIDINWPWSRLSFSMEESVKCIMVEPGFITAFDSGDTIDLSNENIYEENLDYICGNGAGGGYGQCNIQQKYFVFRKKTLTDTNYIFILFSNFNIDFTIHHIISNCTSNPIEIITTSTEEVIDENNILIYPNPCNSIVNISKPISELNIYTMDGKLVLNSENIINHIDASGLKNGMYILSYEHKGKRQIRKLVKK